MAGVSLSGMMNRVASSMATLTNSYIYTGANITLAGAGPNNNSRLNIDTEVYYKFLRSFHFVTALIDIFASTIIETINKTDFVVTIRDSSHSYITDVCNSFLFSSSLKEYLITHMNDIVYRGQYSIGLDLAKGKIIDLIDPYNTEIVMKHGETICYRIGNKLIPRQRMATYYFRAGEITPLQREADKDKNIEADDNKYNEVDFVEGYIPPPTAKAQSADNKKAKKDSMADIIVKCSKFSGESIFKNQLTRIFQMYVLEYALFYLGLRDTLRPELIGLSTGGRQVNVAQSLSMANSVEALLNQATQGLANIVDPLAFINNLTFQILNYVKVVPSVDQYQGMADINQGDLAEKRAKLLQEKQSVQEDILNDLTVPPELFSGQANRWEIMARNDRFMTTCDAFLKSISRFVKDICISIGKAKHFNLKYTDIKFNLDFASMLSAYDVRDKIAKVADKLGELERMSQSFMNLQQMGIFDPEMVKKYLKNQLDMIDVNLANLVSKEDPNAQQQQGEEEAPPEEGMEGGEEMPPEEGMPQGDGTEMQYQNPNA